MGAYVSPVVASDEYTPLLRPGCLTHARALSLQHTLTHER